MQYCQNGGYYPLLHCQVGCKAICHEAHDDAHQGPYAAYLSLILASPLPHGDHPYDDGDDTDNQDGQFKSIKVVIDQGKPVFRYLKILRVKRRNPLHKHISVCHAQNHPQHADNDADEYPSLEQIDDGKCDEYHKSIVQKHHWRPCHIIPGFEYRMSGYGFYGKINDTCQQRMEHQGKPVHECIDRLHLPGKGAVAAFLYNPGPPLSTCLPCCLHIFCLQIFQFMKRPFYIRLLNMDFLHNIPL